MKTAFVTGGNRGIGRGFVEYLLEKGYTVFAGVRSPETYPEDLKSKDNLRIIKIDITEDSSIQQAVKELSSYTDSLNLLVNNAGMNKDTATGGNKKLVCNLADLDRDSLNRMFNVNATSQMIVVKEFLPLLAKTESFIINISSARASYNDEYPTSNANYGYKSSKTALNMLTFCSIYDLPSNVKTFAVHPGGVKTDMNPDGTDDPFKQAGKMIDIIENWNDEFNGKFLRYDGNLYPL